MTPMPRPVVSRTMLAAVSLPACYASHMITALRKAVEATMTPGNLPEWGIDHNKTGYIHITVEHERQADDNPPRGGYRVGRTGEQAAP